MSSASNTLIRIIGLLQQLHLLLLLVLQANHILVAVQEEITDQYLYAIFTAESAD